MTQVNSRSVAISIGVATLLALTWAPTPSAEIVAAEHDDDRAIVLSSGLMLVPVRINSQGPFLFVVDTGSTETLVSPGLAHRLGLEVGGADNIGTIGGITTSARGRIAALEVSNLRLSNLSVHSVDLQVLQQDDPRIDGVIGQSVLHERSFLLDYADRRLRFDEAGGLGRPLCGVPAPLTFIADRPVATVVARAAKGSKPVSLRLVLDSASTDPILLQARAHQAVETLVADGAPRGASAIGTVSGEQVVTVTGVRLALLFPTMRLPHIDASIVPLPREVSRLDDGLLPTHLFRALYFDRATGTVILNPRVNRLSGSAGADDLCRT
jgi:hypothetical protein